LERCTSGADDSTGGGGVSLENVLLILRGFETKICQLEEEIAIAKKRGTPSSRGKHSAPLRQSTTPVNPNVNIHFEAGWTESWSHRRCLPKR
jgi:hypothetical protein